MGTYDWCIVKVSKGYIIVLLTLKAWVYIHTHTHTHTSILKDYLQGKGIYEFSKEGIY